jgi:hypothetical protein
MAEIVFAVPVMHGKEEVDVAMREEMTGARREEYEAALKEAGIIRQAVWHQQLPGGDRLAIVYIEANDPDAHKRFVGADTEISRWFVEEMQGVHGRDVSQPPLPVEPVLDFRV